MTIAKYVDEL